MNKNTITTISKKWGDAFYVFDYDRFNNNYHELLESLKTYYKKANIAYSYKTNYIPPICKIVNANGGYAEVVSEMELDIALKCGVSFNKIIWNGPIKNTNRVFEAAKNGCIINIDNLIELKQFVDFVPRTKTVLNIGIRLNYDVGDDVISRFGFDVESEDFSTALFLIKENKNILLKCVHCHFAKRSLQYWGKRVDKAIEIFHEIRSRYNLNPTILDFGGGIYGKMPSSLKEQFEYIIPSYSDYAEIIGTKVVKAFPECDVEILVEPGTALAADTVDFFCRVKNVKTIRNKSFITVLGSQKNINFGEKNPPIEIVNFSHNTVDVKSADIVGYTCIEGDILCKNYSGKIGVNDFVIFNNCGSYSIVMKPPFILPNFPVLEYKDGTFFEVKKSEKFEDLFITYLF